MSKIALHSSLSILGAAALLSGCLAASEDAPPGESTVDTEEGVAGIVEGSPEALGVLKLASKASYTTLDATAKVGLTSTAAAHIVSYRNADANHTFDTLAELDKVPYVGESAFQKLLAYAKAHGYVEPDACAPPQGAFQVDLPPSSPSQNRKAVLSVPTSGWPSIYTETGWSNGSFYDYNLMNLVRTPDAWEQEYVVYGGFQYYFSQSFAATSDAQSCLAYVFDNDQTLRLRCTSLAERTIASGAYKGVAIAAHGSTKHVVFQGLNQLKYVTDAANVPEIIDAAQYVRSTSLAVSATGVLHVAYIVHAGSTQEIRYATRTGSGWQVQTIDAESGDISDPLSDLDEVSIAVDSAGSPVVAYYHRTTRSLKLAVREGQGFAVTTLEAPRPDGKATDSSGAGVVLRIDCANRQHIVYQHKSLFDPGPSVGLSYARIEGGKLQGTTPVPAVSPGAHGFNAFEPHTLSFVIGADGHQHVAAYTSEGIYYATR